MEIHVRLSRVLIKWENHKLDAKMNESFIFKLITFQLSTQYFPLLFNTIDGEDFSVLSTQVLSFVIGANFINIFKYILLPFLRYRFKRWRFYKKWTPKRAEMKQTILERYHLQDVEDIGNIPLEIQKKYKKDELHRAIIECLSFEEELVYTEQIEISRVMTDLSDIVRKMYTTMISQFGYLVIFGPYFPLASLACFLTNLAIVIFTIRAFSTSIRRSLSIRMSEIGIWNKAIKMLGFFGVFYSVILVIMPGKGIEIILKDPEHYLDRDYFIAYAWLVGVLLFKVFASEVISKKTMWFREKERIENYFLEKENLKQGAI